MSGSGQRLAHTCSLPPAASSAGDARRFVRGVLSGADDDLLDTACLLTSELVTNAVLHAGTDLVLLVTATDGGVRVGVHDSASGRSVSRRPSDTEAATGRGLLLVDALATSFGVDSTATGKTVWFELATAAPTAARPAEPPADLPALPTEPPADLLADLPTAPTADPPTEPPADPPADLPTAPTADPPGTDRRRTAGDPRSTAPWAPADAGSEGSHGPSRPGPPGEVARVTLLGLPTGLVLAAKRHRNALLREAQLVVLDSQAPLGVAAADLHRAQVLSDTIDAELDAALLAATPPGTPVTVSLTLPADAGPDSSVLAATLDRLDAAAAEARLLTRPALPEVRRYRTWLLQQVAAQLSGEPPEAWQQGGTEVVGPPGHFASAWEDRIAGWDVAAIAADDTNCILAANAAAGQLLGWQPDELRGRRLTAIIPPEWRERHVSGFTDLLLSGRSHILDSAVVVPALRADGGTVEVSLLVTAEQSEQGRTVFVGRLGPVHRADPPGQLDPAGRAGPADRLGPAGLAGRAGPVEPGS